MKNLIILILATQLFIGCNVIKNIKKDRTKEKTEQENSTKLDSVAEVKIEEEIISTFVSDSVFNTIDLSEETTVTTFDSIGVVKSIVTTKKTNVKSSGGVVRDNRISETKSELSKVELDKNIRTKNVHELDQKKVAKDIKKTSLPIWIWAALIIFIILLVIYFIWKIEKK